MDYKVEIRDIKSIRPDPNQPRKIFNKEDIENLAASIKEHGIINNIEINPDGIIITGENRWRASKLAGLKTIPCRVVRVEDNEEKLSRQLHENIHHIPMNAMDVARALDTMKQQGMTEHQIATKIGKARTYVQNHLWILKLPEQYHASFKGRADASLMRVIGPMAMQEKKGIIPKGATEGLLEKAATEKIGREKVLLYSKYIRSNPDKASEYLSIESDKNMVELNEALSLLGKNTVEKMNKDLVDIELLSASSRRIISSMQGLPQARLKKLTTSQRDTIRQTVRVTARACEAWLKGEPVLKRRET